MKDVVALTQRNLCSRCSIKSTSQTVYSETHIIAAMSEIRNTLKWGELDGAIFTDVNPTQDGPFWGCLRIGGGGGGGGGGMPKRLLSKSVTHILYFTQRITIKCMSHVTHSFGSADISIFSPKIRNFWDVKIYRLCFDTWFLILLAFLESLKIILISTVTILMRSAKMATLDLLKIKIFWNKGYDIIIYVHYTTNKILSCDSNYIVDVVMWPKFGNSSISKLP